MGHFSGVGEIGRWLVDYFLLHAAVLADHIHDYFYGVADRMGRFALSRRSSRLVSELFAVLVIDICHFERLPSDRYSAHNIIV